MIILKVPFGAGGLGRGNGSFEAPDKILELFKNDSQLSLRFEIKEVDVDEFNVDETHTNIEKSVLALNDKTLILGGDHSITYSSVKAFFTDNEDFYLVVFDAHPDVMNDFETPNHENYLKLLIDKGIVKPQNVVLLGLRSWDVQELDFLDKNNIKYYTSENLLKTAPETIADEILSFVGKSFYLSVDIDVVDAEFAPGTGYPEKGGISPDYLLCVLSLLHKTKKVKITDLVEVNPKNDIDNKTLELAKKIVSCILGSL